jgi:hypothetical protein
MASKLQGLRLLLLSYVKGEVVQSARKPGKADKESYGRRAI